MNTPVPPAPPSSAALQAVLQSAANTGTVVQVTGAQAALQTGQVLLATVLSRAAPGQFVLQTDAGQLTLQTTAALLQGTSLSLQVQSGGQRPQVLILGGGQSGTPAAQAATGQAAGAPLAPGPVVTSVLTEGSTVTATILRPATGTPGNQPPPGATGQIPASAAPGTVGATVGNPTSATTVGSAPATAAASGAAAARAGSGVPTAASQGPLPAGTTVPLRIVAISPPNAPLAAPSGSAGTIVPGTVTGTGPSGQTLVQTPLGEVSLPARTPLPQGTTLHLRFAGAPQLPSFTGEGAPLILSQQWETLRAAVEALQAGDPAAARVLTQQVLPSSGGQMTTGMLFFLSALTSGDVRRWLGEETTRAIQRSASGLLERLGRDFTDMRRLSNEPAAQEWRTYLIPLLVGGNLEQLRLFVRGERDGDGTDGEKGKGTRFVIEVEFSRLGPFQFDGLARGKSIDLLVRTREPLGGSMRENIRRIYTDTVSALGFSGTIDFQRSETFELNPTHEVHARQPGLTA